jgi:predicted amidohydrolase
MRLRSRDQTRKRLALTPLIKWALPTSFAPFPLLSSRRRQPVIRTNVLPISTIACWLAAREEHWRALLRARAIENQCYVATVNRCGRDPSGTAYAGGSRIVDPHGAILVDAGQQEGVIQATLDLKSLRSYRGQFPALRDRRL